MNSTDRERQESQHAGCGSDVRRGAVWCDSSAVLRPEGAIEQPMSATIQTSSQQNSILYLGNNSQCGQTVHIITYNQKTMQCIDNGAVMAEEIPGASGYCKNKKYQCDELFNTKNDFRQHIVSSHPLETPTICDTYENCSVKYKCNTCNKTFKCTIKFDQHCRGHGDPDMECPECHKVFASKKTLRVHIKIHNRKHHCVYCSRSYDDLKGLENHMRRMHNKELARSPAAEPTPTTASESNNMSLQRSNKKKRTQKICIVCKKVYSHLIELKRHLAEHFITSSLQTIPLRQRRSNAVTCVVCRTRSFVEIAEYRAHLLKHAHVHDTERLRCKMCFRKFKSKKSINLHNMKHHDKNRPVNCGYCDETFSLESALDTHVKSTHSDEAARLTSVCCRLCQKPFKTLKAKWDHEWNTHTAPCQLRQLTE